MTDQESRVEMSRQLDPECSQYRLIMFPINTPNQFHESCVDAGVIPNLYTPYDTSIPYSDEDILEMTELLSRYWHDSPYDYAHFLIESKLTAFSERKHLYTRTADGFLPNPNWYPSIHDQAQNWFETRDDFTWRCRSFSNSPGTLGKNDPNSEAPTRLKWWGWIPTLW